MEEKQKTIDREEFLSQIQSEISSSRDFINEKRDIARRNIEKYIDQTVDDEKIPMNTSYAMINIDLAIELMDNQNPIFLPRGISDDEIAENLTDVAAFDVEEMMLDMYRLVLGHDRRMYGVSLITKTGWDEKKSIPTISVKDPLSWLPDPTFDHITPARFHYFEEYIPREMLSEEYGFDEGAEEIVSSRKSETTTLNENARNEKSGYNASQTDLGMVSVINGYTYYDDDLYMVTLTDDGGELLRYVKIKPVFEDEKKTQVPLSTVVNVKWWSPKRGDPMGVSMLEMIGPKQSALSQLYNLRLIDAKFSTLGQTFLYDMNTVQNASELASPSLNPKYIAVDGKNNPISQAVHPVPRNNIMEDSYRVTQEIQNQLQLETGISNNFLVQSQTGSTLGEIKQIQENANARFGLTAIIAERADKEFWRDIWFRSYKEFFSKTDKKFVRVASSIDGTKSLELTKDDFLNITDTNVIIESKRKYESERKQLAASLEAKIAVMAADPNTPKISLSFMQRKLLKLQGFTRSDIQVIVPYTPEEMDARNTVKLLNMDDKDAAIVRDLNEDHMTYLVVFQSALDTEAKELAIEMRKNAYIQSGQSQQQEVGQGAANTATNQMLNASIQQNTSAQPTT